MKAIDKAKAYFWEEAKEVVLGAGIAAAAVIGSTVISGFLWLGYKTYRFFQHEKALEETLESLDDKSKVIQLHQAPVNQAQLDQVPVNQVQLNQAQLDQVQPAPQPVPRNL